MGERIQCATLVQRALCCSTGFVLILPDATHCDDTTAVNIYSHSAAFLLSRGTMPDMSPTIAREVRHAAGSRPAVRRASAVLRAPESILVIRLTTGVVRQVRIMRRAQQATHRKALQ